MPPELSFVDTIATSVVTRLNLNDGTTWRLLEDPAPDFSPPPLKRQVVSSMLRDGAEIPASAYDNREVGLTLLVTAASKDALATQLQTLTRELDRSRNILRYKSTGASSGKEVFFRTFRAPDYELLGPAILEEKNYERVRLRIPAEPFAYGPKVQALSTTTIQQHPAGSPNPLFIDIAGALITGDVPTPAYIVVDWQGVTADIGSVIAVRRHGAPASAIYFLQAELFANLTDCTDGSGDGLSSGGSYKLITPGTVTMVSRMSYSPFPRLVPNLDDRGTYRVFARVKKTVAADVWALRWRLETNVVIHGPTVLVPLNNSNRVVVDLGLMTLPAYPAPDLDGYSNQPPAAWASQNLVIQAQRQSGSSSMNVDYIAFLPADEELMIVSNNGGSNNMTIDGPQDTVYSTGAASACAWVGGIPMLTPNQTNRLYVMKEVGGGHNQISLTVQISVHFWPRFLYIRP